MAMDQGPWAAFEPSAKQPWDLRRVAHLHRRAGFGATRAELERDLHDGPGKSVDRLLNPPDDSAEGKQIIEGLRQGVLSSQDLDRLKAWWLYRILQTLDPLREKLTLFWHGHFATGIPKVRDARLMYIQNQLFRTAGAGSFEGLTQAVAKDGAMMLWLDTSTDKKSHPNENFAREMMELFTLGIGNYTQADVTAGARGFTGWVYERSAYRYLFRPSQHDYGTKTYLAQTGDWNGEDVVHIAVTRPESARFVLARLWSHFAYPVQPSDRVVADLLPAYGPGMDITGALRALFLHPAFRSPASRGGLVKQPAEYLAGAARSLGLDATGARYPAATGGSGPSGPGTGVAGPSRSSRSLARMAAGLGQTLFDPPNVGGWGQNGYWLTTATSYLRLEIALALAHQGDLSPLAGLPTGQRITGVATLLGVDSWGPTTSAALARVASEPVVLTALALTAPEYVLA